MTALSTENLAALFEQQMREENVSRQILLHADHKETEIVTEIVQRILSRRH